MLWAAPSSLRPAERVPDLGDPLHLSWVMAWDAHQLVRRPWALFDSNSFHPYPRSLTFADHLTPEAVAVAPVFWATGNAVLAQNVSVVLALALSALAMFALVRAATGRSEAAWLAGLAYAFNSFTRHELPRVHVLHVQWWPLAVLFLVRFADRGRRRDAAAFGVALALQMLSGTYYLAYTALLLPVWLVCAYRGSRRWPDRDDGRRLLLALAGAALVVLPFVLPYLAQFRAMGFEKELTDGADLLSYVDPEPENVFWRWPRLGVERELPHFVGLVGLAGAAAGAARLLRRGLSGEGHALGLLAVATGVVAVALSLGPHVRVGGLLVGPGPYALLHRLVPPARGMASPERIGVLACFASAALLGLGTAGLLARLPHRIGALVAFALTPLVPIEHLTPMRRPAEVPAGADVPRVYASLAGDAGPLVELPLFPDRAKRLWASYLYFSTYHWRPVPIGRTSFYPPAHDFLAYGLRDFPDDTSLTLLDRLGIRTVVVHPRVWPADERRARLASLEAEGRLRLVAAFEDEAAARFAALGLGEERVYRLGEVAPPAAPCTPADAVDRGGFTVRSVDGIDEPALAVDGDRRTAWRTARPQKPGDAIEVRLPSPETVAAVGLALGYPFDEFPRNLVLLADAEEGGWRRVPYDDGPAERWATVRALLERPREALWVLRFPPVRVRAVRLMVGLREEDPSWPRWQVPELELFRACR